MAFSTEYRQFIESRLAEFVHIRSKPMFGGLGIYSEDLFFALIDDDKLYFKVDQTNQADFVEAGMQPFVPFESAKPMKYWEVPQKVLEHDQDLSVWIDKSLAVASSAKLKKK